MLILDQATKYFAEFFLANGESLILIPNILELRYSKNTGIAFSMFAAYPQVLVIVIALVILYLIYVIATSSKFNPGLACILGGGIGNLLDRFLRGYVVDFINPLFINFAIFNIADTFLNIGMAIIIIEQIVQYQKHNEIHS